MARRSPSTLPLALTLALPGCRPTALAVGPATEPGLRPSNSAAVDAATDAPDEAPVATPPPRGVPLDGVAITSALWAQTVEIAVGFREGHRPEYRVPADWFDAADEVGLLPRTGSSLRVGTWPWEGYVEREAAELGLPTSWATYAMLDGPTDPDLRLEDLVARLESLGYRALDGGEDSPSVTVARLWSHAERRKVSLTLGRPFAKGGAHFVERWALTQYFEGELPTPTAFGLEGPHTPGLMSLPEQRPGWGPGVRLHRNGAYFDQQYAAQFDWVVCIAVATPDTPDEVAPAAGFVNAPWAKARAEHWVRGASGDVPAGYLGDRSWPQGLPRAAFYACEHSPLSTVADDWRDYAVHPEDVRWR